MSDLSNIMEKIDGIGMSMSRAEWKDFLQEIIDDCRMRYEAAEADGDEE